MHTWYTYMKAKYTFFPLKTGLICLTLAVLDSLHRMALKSQRLAWLCLPECWDPAQNTFFLGGREGVFKTGFLCVVLGVLDSICRPSWPQTHRNSLASDSLSAGIKGVRHLIENKHIFLKGHP